MGIIAAASSEDQHDVIRRGKFAASRRHLATGLTAVVFSHVINVTADYYPIIISTHVSRSISCFAGLICPARQHQLVTGKCGESIKITARVIDIFCLIAVLQRIKLQYPRRHFEWSPVSKSEMNPQCLPPCIWITNSSHTLMRVNFSKSIQQQTEYHSCDTFYSQIWEEYYWVILWRGQTRWWESTRRFLGGFMILTYARHNRILHKSFYIRVACPSGLIKATFICPFLPDNQVNNPGWSVYYVRVHLV